MHTSPFPTHFPENSFFYFQTSGRCKRLPKTRPDQGPIKVEEEMPIGSTSIFRSNPAQGHAIVEMRMPAALYANSALEGRNDDGLHWQIVG
jgi:hypothetical protein